MPAEIHFSASPLVADPLNESTASSTEGAGAADVSRGTAGADGTSSGAVRSPSSARRWRTSPKNSRSRAAHSSPSTPGVTANAWLRRASAWSLNNDPVAPPLGSGAPNTHRSIRALTISPAHMQQGSSVTYTVHPVRRQRPSARAAAHIAVNSAWAEGSSLRSRRLCARDTISPR